MNLQVILAGVLPSIGVALLFFFVIRGVIRGDRNERAALAAQEAQAAAASAKQSTPNE
jgi:hypothetical protein